MPDGIEGILGDGATSVAVLFGLPRPRLAGTGGSLDGGCVSFVGSVDSLDGCWDSFNCGGTCLESCKDSLDVGGGSSLEGEGGGSSLEGNGGGSSLEGEGISFD